MGAPAEITDQRPIILFDGVCNLCNGSVQFIIKRDPTAKFRFASLQSNYAKALLKDLGMSGEHLYSIILVKNTMTHDRSDALLEITRELNGAWPILYVFRFLPKVLRDRLYEFVAANRYKWFGRKDSCMIPTADLRERFLE